MNKFPFIIPSLLFITGILANYYGQVESTILLIVLIATLSILIISISTIKNISKNSLPRIFLYILFFVLGSYSIALHEESKFFLPSEIESIDNLVVIGSVEKIDLRKENEISFNVRTDSIRIDTAYQKINILLICRVRDDNERLVRLYSKLNPGNQVRIEGEFMRGREERNPGEFNYDKYLRSKGITGVLFVKDEYDVKIIDWEANIFKSLIFNIRKTINQRISLLHNKQSSGLIRGLLLADRSNIDYETKTEFINSGVIHILAVSGLHVGYIVVIFIFLFGRFNIYLKSLLTILGLVIFLLLTGMPVSVIRAVVMAITIIVAYLTNRTTNLYNSLAVAAFILLIINPEELFSPGFQLSFLAVLSIAVIYPIVQRYINDLRLKSKVVKYILLFAGVSLSVQIGTLPVTLIYFGKLSIVALISNLIVIPLVGAVVAIAIVTLVLSIIPFPIYGLFAAANEFLIYHLFKFISFMGSNKFSFVPIKHFTGYDAIIFYLMILITIIFFSKLNTLKGKVIFVFLVLINGVILSSLDDKELLRNGKLNILMIDVYRGTSVLIKTPNDQTILVGGGFSSLYFDTGERTIKPLLEYLNVDKIDLAVITSMKRENFGGMISLIKNGIIKKIIKSKTDSSSIVDISFEELLLEKNISVKYFSKDTMNFGDIKLYFMNNSDSHVNNSEVRSSFFKLVYGNTSLLFAGELENDMEYKYCEEYGSFLKSDVLVVANNGSINSTSVDFLKTVNPKISLISVSNQNKFTISSSLISDRLTKYNIDVFRTDKDKAILLQSDGKKFHKVNWN